MEGDVSVDKGNDPVEVVHREDQEDSSQMTEPVQATIPNDEADTILGGEGQERKGSDVVVEDPSTSVHARDQHQDQQPPVQGEQLPHTDTPASETGQAPPPSLSALAAEQGVELAEPLFQPVAGLHSKKFREYVA